MDKKLSCCPKCGKHISDRTIICSGCGKKVSSLKTFYYPKNWLLTLILCVTFGNWGAHRFYTGHVLTGLLQMLTFGGLGLWTLADISSILCNSYKDAEGIELLFI